MTCIGLSWTSPEIVLIDISREKYRTFVAKESQSRHELELFLAAEDSRDAVVLVQGISTLARLADLSVHFVCFDTPTLLRSIQGIVAMDQDPTKDDCAMIRITMADLEKVLDGPFQAFTVPKDIIQISAALASKITLKELITKTARKGGDAVTQEYIQKTCERIVGRISKATWLARVRTPALKAGLDSQVHAELERFVDDSSVSDGLWRGFYDLVELQEPLDSVLKKYDVRASDLEYLTDILGSDAVGPENYVTSPLQTKKRRG